MQWAGVDACYEELASAHGHDGFLAEADLLASLISPHLIEKGEARLAAEVTIC
jgi:homoserine acetyltransferase